jgi:hypothetical protein
MENPFASTEGKAAIARRLVGVDVGTVGDYIDDAWANALRVAPCLSTLEDEDKEKQVAAILRSIILRWHESGTNSVTGKVAGPFQLQLGAQPRRGYNLQPSEIVDLSRFCKRQGRPFMIDTTPEEQPGWPLQGATINGYCNGPHGEWSPDAPEVP